MGGVSPPQFRRRPSHRNTEAAELKHYILANIPAGDYLVLGGDFNLTSRKENCVQTLATTLATTAPLPIDQANNDNTNSGREGVLDSHKCPAVDREYADNSSTETVTDPDASVYEIVLASSVGLSVTATDNRGEAALTYTWSSVNGPGSPVVILTNGNDTAKNMTAAFQAIGDNTLTVTVQDVLGLSVASSVKASVTQKANSLTKL